MILINRHTLYACVMCIYAISTHFNKMNTIFEFTVVHKKWILQQLLACHIRCNIAMNHFSKLEILLRFTHEMNIKALN